MRTNLHSEMSGAPVKKRLPCPIRTFLGALLLVLIPLPLSANPTGASVASGTASITASGSTLSIANSAGAVINWQSFSINAGELTKFIQPSAASSVLNRVVGGNLSTIYGTLQSNGQVFLVNPSGIVIGASGIINTAGFVASTLDVSDAAFSQYAAGAGGGNLTFLGSSTAKVQNLGTINAAGGNVFLIGQQVENGGTLSAPQGTVGLYASSQVYLTTGQPDAGSVLVTASNLAGGTLPTGVSNTGLIQAVQAELKATGNMYALAVNNAGTVHATGVSTHDGVIHLGAPGGVIQNTGTLAARNADGSGGTVQLAAGSGGTVYASGLIDVSSTTAETKGGTAQLTGDNVALYDGGIINASGPAGGGTILVGGDSRGTNPQVYDAQNVFVSADASINTNATDNGNGGKVVLWSNGTTQFYGSISAQGGPNGGNGGSVETSGEGTLIAAGTVLTSAPHGAGGNWLLDPTGDLTIEDAIGTASVPVTGSVTFSAPTASAAGANYILNSSLETALTNNASVTITAGSDIAWTGNFTLSSSTGANTLILQAGGQIDLGHGTSLTTLAIDNASGNFLTLDFEAASDIHVYGLTVNAGFSGTFGTSPVTLNFLSRDGGGSTVGSIDMTNSTIYTLGGNILMSGGTTDPSLAANGSTAPTAAGYTPTYYAEGDPSDSNSLYDGVVIAGSTILASPPNGETGATIAIYGKSAAEASAVGVRVVDSVVGVESQGTGGTLVVVGKSVGTDADSYGVSLEAGAGLWVDGQGPSAIGNVTAPSGNLYLTAIGGTNSQGLNISSTYISNAATSATGNYYLGDALTSQNNTDSGLIVTTGAALTLTTDSINYNNNLEGSDVFYSDANANTTSNSDSTLLVMLEAALNADIPTYLSGATYIGHPDPYASETIQPYTLSTTIGVGASGTGTLIATGYDEFFATTTIGRPDGTGDVNIATPADDTGPDSGTALTIYGGSITIGSNLDFAGSNISLTLVANGSYILQESGTTFTTGASTDSITFTLANSSFSNSFILLDGTIASPGTVIFNANAGSIQGNGSFSAGSFVLDNGTWSQIGTTLPTFSATDFTLAGGTFIRATSGDGSSGSPYQIADVYGLQGIGSPSGALLSDNFVLANNIDATGTSAWNGGAGFVPIGNSTNPYLGTFNGNGNTISNLTINLPEATDSVGLFGQLGETTYTDGVSGTIENVGLLNVDITGNQNVGGLVGTNSFSTIDHSYVTGTVTGGDNTGGLVGSSTGALEGETTVYATVQYSYSTATVNGASQTGGLIGLGFDDVIQYSYATGDVSGTNSVGGLAGSDDYGTTSYCFALGDVTGTSSVGGLIGYSGSSTIQESYSTGEPSGSSAVGGFVGHLDFDSGGSFAANYWDTDTSGTMTGVGDSSSDQVTGLNTAQITDSSSFGPAWNFSLPTGNNGTLVTNGVWGNDPSVYAGLPYFQWQHPYLVLTPLDQSVVYGTSISAGSLGTTYSVAGLTGTDTVSTVLFGPGPTLAVTGSNVDVGTTNSISISDTLNSGENYILTYGPNATESFTPAPLTLSFTGTVSKTYDGTTTAPLSASNYALDGFVSSDGSALSASVAAASYADADAGTGLAVIATGVTLSGSKASDYTLATTASADIGIITPAPLAITLSGSTVSKTYDGTTLATLSTPDYTVTSGLVGSDSVTLSGTGTYAASTAGSETVTVAAGPTLGGSKAGDYTPTFTGGTTSGTIIPADLTLTAANQSKIADTTFSFTGTEFNASGLQAGETVGDVTLTSPGAPAAAAPGNYDIDISGATGGTFNPANYNMSYVNGVLLVNAATTTTPPPTTADSIVPPVIAAQVLPVVLTQINNASTQATSTAALATVATSTSTSGASGGTDATVGTGSNSDPDTGASTNTSGGGGKKSATLGAQTAGETSGGGAPVHESVATQGAAGSIGGGGVHVNIPPPPEVTSNFNKVLGPAVLNQLKAALSGP